MKTITKSQDVYALVSEPLKAEEQEYLIAITLNGANIVKDIHWLTCGDDGKTIISNKQIARCAILDNARGVILVHNHPSGNPHPSGEDIKMTESLRNALAVFEISLLDHIVVCDDCYFSFADEETHHV